MTTEYIVLGALLIVMGGVQTWLRHGAAGKVMQAEQEQLAARRAEAMSEDGATRADRRSKKAWTSWTAMLGGVSVVLGVVLVVLGVLGR
ncbi:MAG: hypothetical protein GX113_02395 [Actinobacteria bacterium]|nr:hypothetical protein [Actinomycetota bacterium]